MLPRPRIRIPLSLAAAIVAAAYVVRSAMRGFDFRPDMPVDAFAGGLFLLVLGMVAYLRHTVGASEDGDEPSDTADDSARPDAQ
jgi:hypothetical protein